MISKYRSGGNIVEAVQYQGPPAVDNTAEILEFIGGAMQCKTCWNTGEYERDGPHGCNLCNSRLIAVPTAKGSANADWGDWIVKSPVAFRVVPDEEFRRTHHGVLEELWRGLELQSGVRYVLLVEFRVPVVDVCDVKYRKHFVKLLQDVLFDAGGMAGEFELWQMPPERLTVRFTRNFDEDWPCARPRAESVPEALRLQFEAEFKEAWYGDRWRVVAGPWPL